MLSILGWKTVFVPFSLMRLFFAPKEKPVPCPTVKCPHPPHPVERTLIMFTLKEFGNRISMLRKLQNLTQDELSEKICKSKSTISKYEKGEIAVDVETLYEIADAIGVHVEQLLSQRSFERKEMQNEFCPAFFRGRNRFYGYIFDGRSNQLIRCVFDLLSKDERNRDKVMMYMNFKDYAHYQKCENTYWGYMEHYNAVTNIHLVNQDSPMEKASAQLLASYLDSDTKWGLFNGFSSRPMMPIAAKMLFSKEKLKEDDALLSSLKISKEDIRVMKLYNMMAIT